MITLANIEDTTRVEPYRFDGPYEKCFNNAGAGMDKRHIYILHEILKCWPFKSALEIGSFDGASSTAFVEALNSGKGLGESGNAVFCEVSIRPNLYKVLQNGPLSRIALTPRPSWQVLDTQCDFDFVFVDGAHDLDTVSIETTKLLKRRPLCIMAHDTNSTRIGIGLSEGAEFLANTFGIQPDYYCLEDNEDRPGEMTKRGLFFATTNRDLYEKAQRIFKEWNR